MDVDIHIFIKIFRNTESRGVAANKTQGRGCRLFHYIAQLTGQQQSLFALHGCCFDEQYIAAGWSPGEPYGHTGPGNTRIYVGHNADMPQVFSNIFDGHCFSVWFTFRNHGCHTAADIGDLAFQIAYACFACIAGNYIAQRFSRKLELFGSQPVFR